MSESSEEGEAAAADFVSLELPAAPGDFFSFGDLVATFRMCDEMNEAEFAKVVGVSESYVRDVEACSEVVSPAQAAAWARAVGYIETEFVRRLLQDQLDAAGLQMCVSVEPV